MRASRSVFVCPSGSMMEYDTENMNSEEIYSSLRGVTEAIQNFSYRSQEDLNEPLRPEGKRDDAVSLVPGQSMCAVSSERRSHEFPLSHRHRLCLPLLSFRRVEKA